MTDADASQVQRWIEESPAAGADWIAYWDEHAWTDDIDHRAIEGAPDDVGPIIGRPALSAYYQEWVDMFNGLEVTAKEVPDATAGNVIVRWRVTGTAKASGVRTQLDLYVAYWLRDGKVYRMREYMTREEAEAAMGEGPEATNH
jgi:hypothetical protein